MRVNIEHARGLVELDVDSEQQKLEVKFLPWPRKDAIYQNIEGFKVFDKRIDLGFPRRRVDRPNPPVSLSLFYRKGREIFGYPVRPSRSPRL